MDVDEPGAQAGPTPEVAPIGGGAIELRNESGTPADLDLLRSLARFLLQELRIDPASELSVLLVDVDTMTDLHIRWMDEPGPTDVLSFPMDELRAPPDGELPVLGVLGDIVLCPEVARTQGSAAGHDTDAELALLLTHGLLHLLGHDHAEADEERVMFALQADLLARWRSATGTGVST